MYESLMKSGNYRVDYFNEEARGTTLSYAFYVRGDPPQSEAYSHSAKRHLLSGLIAIKASLGLSHLTGIYLDIAPAEAKEAAAFLQLASDLKKGFFKRLVVCSQAEFNDSTQQKSAIKSLQKICPDLELIVLQNDTDTGGDEISGSPLL